MTTSPPDADTPPGFLRGQAQAFEDIALGVPLEACLERLTRLIQGQTPGMRCSVVLLDAAGRHLRLVAAPDVPAVFNARVDGMVYDPETGTCCPAMHARRLAVTPDILLDPRWAVHWALATECGLRSCWSQPILTATGRVLGSFALYGGAPGSPGARDRETLQIGAHLAAVAVERAQHEAAPLAQANAQLRARARQQEAVAELGRHALEGMDEEELMQEAMGTVAALLETEFGGILECTEPESGQLRLRACVGWEGAQDLIGQPVATADPAFITGYTLRCADPVVFEDLAEDGRFQALPGMLASEIVCGAVARIGGGAQPFGLIGGASARRRAFTRDDVNFLCAVANVLAAAVERGRAEETVRQARHAAERANNAKSEFLSRMSHELRTPLNAILGFSQLLEIEPLNAGQRESVEQITRAGRHLLELVNEVLDLARIDAGRFALAPEPLEVEAVLHEALDLIRPLAAARHISLEFGASGAGVGRAKTQASSFKEDSKGRQDQAEAAGSQPGSGGEEAHGLYVLADRQRLRQVLLNLLGNAVKFNREGGRVSLDGEAAPGDGGRVRLTVRDNGPGIAPEHVGRLFTPFERLGAEDTETEGSGIGLALSQRLVESQGGTLGVETAPGVGSTFWVELPGASAASGEIELDLDARLHGEIFGFAAEEEVAAEPEPPKPRTVLHIDDHEANRLLVTMLLARRPHLRLLTASRGREGLELARAHHPALVLLDLHLPDLPGEEVLNALRQDERTSGARVVIVSADAAAVKRHQQVGIGADSYLLKPFNVNQFLKLLDDWTEGEGKQKDEG